MGSSAGVIRRILMNNRFSAKCRCDTRISRGSIAELDRILRLNLGLRSSSNATVLRQLIETASAASDRHAIVRFVGTTRVLRRLYRLTGCKS